MNKNQSKIKLTDKDRKTLLANLKICTDSHGENCGNHSSNEKDKVMLKL